MLLHFSKYQGTGNDFVIINNPDNSIRLSTEQVRFMCDRRFGIGADGLMLLNSKTGYDFEMIYYNADGKESTMCGNGGRCLVKFAYDNGLQKNAYKFIAIDGEHEALIQENGNVSLKMNDVHSVKTDDGGFVLNTGSPHLVLPVNNVREMNVFEKGSSIRYSPPYKAEGINVNFVEEDKDERKIYVRTYERGVENETLSCGTGVTAAALVYAKHSGFNHIDIETPGGLLTVEYYKTDDTHFKDIWLCGPADFVFKGYIEIM